MNRLNLIWNIQLCTVHKKKEQSLRPLPFLPCLYIKYKFTRIQTFPIFLLHFYYIFLFSALLREMKFIAHIVIKGIDTPISASLPIIAGLLDQSNAMNCIDIAPIMKMVNVRNDDAVPTSWSTSSKIILLLIGRLRPSR